VVDRDRALKLAGDLAISYPGRTVSEQHAKRWAGEFLSATDLEARQAVEVVTKRLIDPPSRAQLRQALDEVRKKTMSPAFDDALCVFVDGVECRNCGEVHGHLIDPGQIEHGIFHLRKHWSGEQGQLEPAKRPESCGCGFAPKGKDDITSLAGELFQPTPERVASLEAEEAAHPVKAVTEATVTAYLSGMIEVLPDDPCDRCGHLSRRHVVPSVEEVTSRCLAGKGHQACVCDGFEVRR
jgi:hypothetical protein